MDFTISECFNLLVVLDESIQSYNNIKINPELVDLKVKELKDLKAKIESYMNNKKEND